MNYQIFGVDSLIFKEDNNTVWTYCVSVSFGFVAWKVHNL